MDALTLKAEIFELNSVITGARVEKAFLPSDFEIILKTSAGNLLISSHPTHYTINLTDHRFENPDSQSAFVMLLRKHIVRGKIESVKMDGFERVVNIHISNTNEMFEPVSFTIVAELMGKHSNIILVDGNGTVLESIKHVPFSVSRVRQVLPGVKYTLPPVNDCSAKAVDDYSFTGLNASTKDMIKNGELTADDCIKSIENPAPCVLKKNGKASTPLSFRPYGKEYVPFDTMSKAFDSFYFSKDSHIQSIDIIRNVNTILKRLERSKKVHEKSLAADEEKYRLYGELITGNAYNIKSGEGNAVVENYYTGEKVTIPLDKKLSPHENAQKYYKRYSKLKAGKVHAAEQIEIINSQKEYLENVLVFLSNASSQRDIEACRKELGEQGFLKKKRTKNKEQKLEPLKFKSTDGFTIRVGRNSVQNDELTMKKSAARDVWCHVKDIPGSHAVIQTDGKEVSYTAVLEACALAAYYSKARNSANVPVDYTLIRHVKKPAHALPGKVIYTNQKTVYVTPGENELPSRVL